MRLSHRPSVLLAAVGSVVVVSSAFAAPAGVTGFSSFGNGTAARVNLLAGLDQGAIGFNADNTSLKITDGRANEAVSAWTSAPVDYGTAFTASWIYTVPGNSNLFNNADGFTWTLQNDARGNLALGGAGGAMGYGADAATSTAAVSPSVSAQTVLYSTRRLGFQTNGTVSSSTSGNTNTTTVPVLNNGVPKLFTVIYGNGVLRQTITELGTSTTAGLANHTYTRTLDVSATLGSPTAYMGFTGGSGQVTADQTVGNFRFASYKNYSPIAITGYNADMVVDASAPAGANYVTSNIVNATMDTARLATGATFYERGWNNRTTSGLPMGTTITSASESGHTYAFASATGNNAVLIDNANATARVNFAAPATYGALSLLTSSGNGSVIFSMTLHFTDGTTEAVGSVASMDWYNFGPTGILALSRINNVTAGTADTVGTSNPQLYTYDVPVANSSKLMDYVDFQWTNGLGHAAIFSISGAAPVIPEPSALAVLALTPMALRRRR